MTKKEFDNFDLGNSLIKKSGMAIEVMFKNESGDLETKTTKVVEDVPGKITKFDPNDSDYVYVLWQGQTHSERVHYSDLKGINQ